MNKDNEKKTNNPALSADNRQNSKDKDKEIEKELKSIYSDGKGKMPNLTQLDYSPKTRKRNIFIGAILVLSVLCFITFFGFIIFRPNPKFSNKKVGLEITAPFTISSGEQINYHLKISNNEGVSLTNAQLIINFPANFTFINSNLPASNSDPQSNAQVKVWKIGDLFPGKSEIIDINGFIIGPINSRQTLSANLSFIPANFSSEFQLNETFTTEIISSLVNIEPEFPAQLANLEQTDLKIKLRNKSEQTALANMQFELEFPAELQLMGGQIISPEKNTKDLIFDKNKSESSPYTVDLSGLLPQEEKILIYRGKFDVSEGKKVDLIFRVKQKNDKNEYILQEEKALSLEIIKGDLLTNLIIQGSNQNKAVNFGDTLNYLISLENKSSKPLGDIKVRAVIDSNLLDHDSLIDQNKGQWDNNQILWTKDQISGLGILFPEDEIQINFQIKIKDYDPNKTYSAEDLQIKSFFETQINAVDNSNSEIETESNTIINEINTNLTLFSEGRYFGDASETLGSGPLPPIVGQKTTYKIFWKLTNSLHEINGIEVKAKLPDNISFEGNQTLTSGNLFKNQNNEIVWQIYRIPTSVSQTQAEFEISLTPKPEDAQKILTLLQDINLKATDSQTKGEISITVPGLTTNLDTDPLGKGKGLIQTE